MSDTMNRTKKLIFNTASSLTLRIVSIICGFILPQCIMIYYGSAVNGLVSSITNFLSIIALMELGIGPVIQANLYEPLSKRNTLRISQIVKSAERFFHTLAYIFLVYIAGLAFIFPKIVQSEFSGMFTVSLLLIIAISTFAQYFFGITYQLLLNADQRVYIPLSLQACALVLNTILSVILIKTGHSIQIVKLTTATIFTLRPLCQLWYVKRHYQFEKNIILTTEPIKQKWNGMAQHLAGFACGNTDIIVLTLFSTLQLVSVFSVYYSITLGLTQLCIAIAGGLSPLFGNLLACNEMKRLRELFSVVELLMHLFVVVIFGVASVSILPFVSIYTRHITDVSYIVPCFAYLMVGAYALQSLRIPYVRLVEAAGHFKQTQNASFISMFINISLSVGLVFPFGLAGVAFGTLASMLYEVGYYSIYLKHNILNRPFSCFVKYAFVDGIIVLLSLWISYWIKFDTSSYTGWIIGVTKVASIWGSMACGVHLLFHYDIFITLKGLIMRRIRHDYMV